MVVSREVAALADPAGFVVSVVSLLSSSPPPPLIIDLRRDVRAHALGHEPLARVRAAHHRQLLLQVADAVAVIPVELHRRAALTPVAHLVRPHHAIRIERAVIGASRDGHLVVTAQTATLRGAERLSLVVRHVVLLLVA